MTPIPLTKIFSIIIFALLDFLKRVLKELELLILFDIAVFISFNTFVISFLTASPTFKYDWNLIFYINK